MSIRRSVAAGSVFGAVLLGACGAGLAADETTGLRALTESKQVAPQTTGSIAMPMLRVKPRAVEKSRYVEKPWKSYVCVGCEMNNRPSPDR